MSIPGFSLLPPEQQAAILAGPAAESPDGVYQLVNPPNKNGVAHGAIAACLSVSTICVAVRLYTRVFKLRSFHPEDFLMCFAYACYIGFIYAAYRFLLDHGFFVHTWDLSISAVIDIGMILHIGGVCYSVSLPFLKAAILLEWSRVFVPNGVRNFFWWLCTFMMVAQLLLFFAAMFAMNLACRPIEAIWDITIEGAECIEKSHLEIASAAIHLFYDIIILLLPQKVIWNLQMSFQQKLGVSLIFSVGLLATASAAARLGYTVIYSDSTDAIYLVSSVALWALAEMTCGFMVFCIPSFPKAFRDTGVATRIRGTLRSWTGMGSGNKSTGAFSTGVMSARSHNLTNKSGSHVEMYTKLDEDGMPLAEIKSVSGSGSTEHLRDYSTGDASIVRTTKFTTGEEYVNDRDLEKSYGRQHPWQGGRAR